MSMSGSTGPIWPANGSPAGTETPDGAILWAVAGSQPKILIAVPTCWAYNYFDGSPTSQGHTSHMPGRTNAVRDTWYQDWKGHWRHKFDFKFFVGTPPAGPPQGTAGQWEDTVVLNAPDDYRGLPHKVRAMFQWALGNGYDYVFKADDDVFVWLGRLAARHDPQADYTGFVAERDTGPYVCGASYWVSRRAMQLVADAPIPPDVWAEDRWVGDVLLKNGILARHDERHRVCHCEICEGKYPVAGLTSFHIWPDLNRMYDLHGKSKPKGN